MRGKTVSLKQVRILFSQFPEGDLRLIAETLTNLAIRKHRDSIRAKRRY